MAQRRSKMTPVYLEPMLNDALDVAVNASDETKSGYVRNLIIEDLKQRELITDKMIAENLC